MRSSRRSFVIDAASALAAVCAAVAGAALLGCNSCSPAAKYGGPPVEPKYGGPDQMQPGTAPPAASAEPPLTDDAR